VYYSNKNFDHLLDKGLAQVEKVKRIKLIKSALEILNKDHPYIYLWYPKVIWAMQKNIVVDPLFPNTNFVPLINVKRVE
jgi:peptide/nickel transport system substrate-binding protein